MSLRVIVPPAPILAPTDISPSYADDDAKILALIAAATAEIDGPEGWLGRALGEQTLELVTSDANRQSSQEIWLPCPPIVSIVSVVYLDYERTPHTLDEADYEQTDFGLRLKRSLLPGIAWRYDDALRIRYVAGYNGTAVLEGGTGAVPARATEAIGLSVQQLSALGADNLFVSSETVEGVGSTSYVVTQNAEQLIQTVMARLLTGLRVYR